MTVARRFHHFPVAHCCPVAQTLEALGERWALLIVRDLLRGPLRFSDLERYLAGITPKRLTAHLRALEAAGLVARDQVAGRREVWYRLTPAGRELGPVVEALAAWGFAHALQPPAPGAAVYPEQLMAGLGAYLRRRGPRLAGPATWVVQFADGPAYTVRYDGERWATEAGDAPQPDVRVVTTPEDLAAFLAAGPEERPAERLQLSGAPERVAELLAALPSR
jgi:DNA-binding HxlR family transcriptional regulator